MNELTFLQYRYKNSFLHKQNATLKLIAFITLCVLLFFVNSFIWFIPFLLLTISLMILAKYPPKAMHKQIRFFIWIIVFAFIFNILFFDGNSKTIAFTFLGKHFYCEAFSHAGIMAIRMLFLSIMPCIFTYSTPPLELAGAIENILTPLKLFKINTNAIALSISIVIRYIEILFVKLNTNIMISNYRKVDNSGGIKNSIKTMSEITLATVINSILMADSLAESIYTRAVDK